MVFSYLLSVDKGHPGTSGPSLRKLSVSSGGWDSWLEPELPATATVKQLTGVSIPLACQVRVCCIYTVHRVLLRIK